MSVMAFNEASAAITINRLEDESTDLANQSTIQFQGLRPLLAYDLGVTLANEMNSGQDVAFFRFGLFIDFGTLEFSRDSAFSK